MADAAVEFLLENLKQLLVHHAHLLKDAMDQVEKLENHLRLFKAFLKDAPKQWREDETLRELIRRIRNAVYEAEDIIDAYVTQAAQAKHKNYFLRAIHGPAKIVSIAEKVESVLNRIDDIYTDKSRILDFAYIKAEDGAIEHTEFKKTDDTYASRPQGEAPENITQGLASPEICDGYASLRLRQGGDSHIHLFFRNFCGVLLGFGLQLEFIMITEDIKIKTEKELADLVLGYLENVRFLLVMDDVWSCEDWDKLKIALPITNKCGKVLITSCQVELGWHVNHRKGPHLLRFLTPEESILLLQLEVFREPKFPGGLEIVGRLIAERCVLAS
ncbi:hypothetical protein C2S51_015029 [Perilla frutescens var. frutescens]|nr:hypothetical protein C2S51_015029 [Perilla frutescens var. frutescens]